MKYFIDESGDVGFSEKSSKYLVIAIFGGVDEHALKRILKKTRQRKLKKSIREMPEFKASGLPDNLRLYILKEIVKLDVEVYAMVVHKKQVKEEFQGRNEELYNHAMGTICAELPTGNLDLVFDKRHTSPRLRDNLRRVIRDHFSRRPPDKKSKGILEMTDLSSKNSAGIQMADFIAWAIFQKYERRKCEYYDIIKGKIIIKKSFPSRRNSEPRKGY